MYYHIISLNESATEYDTKKYYCKLALIFHPNKNKHSRDSPHFCLIQEAEQELEGVLRHNDTMRRNQEREEDRQRQE